VGTPRPKPKNARFHKEVHTLDVKLRLTGGKEMEGGGEGGGARERGRGKGRMRRSELPSTRKEPVDDERRAPVSVRLCHSSTKTNAMTLVTFVQKRKEMGKHQKPKHVDSLRVPLKSAGAVNTELRSASLWMTLNDSVMNSTNCCFSTPIGELGKSTKRVQTC
jgi:hypothetical protein